MAPLVSLFFSSKLISKTSWGSFFCLSFFLPQPSLCWGMDEMNPNGDDLWPFLSYSSTQQTRLPFSCYSSCALFIGISFWLLCFLLGPSLVFHFPLLSYIERYAKYLLVFLSFLLTAFFFISLTIQFCCHHT